MIFPQSSSTVEHNKPTITRYNFPFMSWLLVKENFINVTRAAFYSQKVVFLVAFLSAVFWLVYHHYQITVIITIVIIIVITIVIIIVITIVITIVIRKIIAKADFDLDKQATPSPEEVNIFQSNANIDANIDADANIHADANIDADANNNNCDDDKQSWIFPRCWRQ